MNLRKGILLALCLVGILAPVGSQAFFRGGSGPISLPTPWMQVATATYIPNTISADTLHAIMSRTCRFYRDSTLASKIIYPGFAVLTGNNTLGAETSPGNNVIYNGWVEYPVGNPVGITTPALCGGLATCNAPALGLQVSDAAAVTIPNNSMVCHWMYEPPGQHIVYTSGNTNVGGFLYTTAAGCTGNGCEASELGTSGVITTPGAITDNQNGTLGIAPAAVIAQTSIKSIYSLSDSRGAGAKSLADATYDLGNIAPSIGPTTAYINGGVSGYRGSAFYWSHTNQMALAAYTSAVISELSINELVQFQGAQNVLNYERKLAHLFGTLNMPFSWTTLEPNTTTTDSCATVANQTATAWDGQRIAYNDAIRAGGLGVSTYFEVANVLEVNNVGAPTQDGGFWAAPGNSPDCLHETYAGNQAIKSSGNITASAALAASIPTTALPSGDMTMVSPVYDTATPKFGSAALSSGYGAANGGVVPGVGPVMMGVWAKFPGTPAATNQWMISSAIGSIGVRGTNCFLGIQIGNGTQQSATDTSVCDGGWHWVTLLMNPTSATTTVFTMAVDCVVPGNGTLTTNIAPGNFGASKVPLAIRTSASVLGSFEWPGEVDEAAIFYGTTTCTVPTGPFTGTESGLIAAYHLDSSGAATTGPSF